MENTKNIVIDDLGKEVHLRISLFNAERGLDFVDNLFQKVRTKEGFSIKDVLDDLLPLVSLLDANGDKVVKEGLSRQDCYSIFENPLSIVDLGMEVFNFQLVFMENSKVFRPYAKALQDMFNMPTLG